MASLVGKRMKQTFTIGVFGIIKDKQNRVLLILRNDYDLWNLPGGGLEKGESPWQGVIREVKEETGLNVSVTRLAGVYSKPDVDEIVFSFECKIIDGELTLNEEAKDFKYFSLQEIPKNSSSKQFERIKDLLEDENKMMQELSLLTLKPILYIVNVDEASASDLNWTSPLGSDRLALPLSVKIESELVDLTKEEAAVFMAELRLNESGLDRVIKKCYELLNLITYFTSGEKESRAWTVSQETKAPQAAGVIHTDFEKAFICAEIINWKDFVELGEVGAKATGKMRTEGKNYVMQDGDTCYFKIGI